jgi:hypothetical protein
VGPSIKERNDVAERSARREIDRLCSDNRQGEGMKKQKDKT